MRNILQILIFLFSTKVFACDCDSPTITEKYIQSDFVANITITKIYPNKKGEYVYKADIKINELYKGEKLKSIYVAGVSDGGFGTSCSIFIPENTKLIAYSQKGADGNFSLGMCSGLMYLDYSNMYRKKTRKTTKELEKQQRELNILSVFKKNNIDFTDKIIYQEETTLSEKLEQFKGIDLEKKFGIYQITFSSDLSIKKVETINGFNDDLDDILKGIIKTSKWNSFDEGIQNKVPENSKLLIGIYYYNSDKDYPSFISQFYL